MNSFTLLCGKPDGCANVVVGQFRLPRDNLVIAPDRTLGERLVKLNDEVVFEIRRNTAAVASGVSDHLIFRGDHFDVRTVIKGVNNDPRLFVFRECEPEDGRTLSGRNLCCNVVIRKVDAVIVRASGFGFVREPTSTIFAGNFQFARHCEDRKLAVIIDPRAGLMRLLEPLDFISVI